RPGRTSPTPAAPRTTSARSMRSRHTRTRPSHNGSGGPIAVRSGRRGRWLGPARCRIRAVSGASAAQERSLSFLRWHRNPNIKGIYLNYHNVIATNYYWNLQTSHPVENRTRSGGSDRRTEAAMVLHRGSNPRCPETNEEDDMRRFVLCFAAQMGLIGMVGLA